MRLRLRHVLVLFLAATACEGLFEPEFPPMALTLEPPPEYRVWWEVVESCSGRKASFDAVSWFRVPAGHLEVRGESALGAWFVSGNRIALADGFRNQAYLVRHEMLHSILRDGSHPKEYFQGACADEVICGRECKTSSALPGAIELSLDALEVDASLFPLEPSLGRDGGQATVVVTVRNPNEANAYVPAQSFSAARCAVGFLMESVPELARAELDCRYLDYMDDGRIYFRPGESRRLVFEVDLRTPTYGGAPFPAGRVTVSAIFADNVRGTQEVLIRP